MRYALLIYRTDERTDEGAGGTMASDGGRHPHCPGSSTAHDLADPTTATTLRLRGGRVLLTDGPVADHAEQLRGVVVIDVRDLDAAIAVAAAAPDAREGAVEIRPVRVPT